MPPMTTGIGAPTFIGNAQTVEDDDRVLPVEGPRTPDAP